MELMLKAEIDFKGLIIFFNVATDIVEENNLDFKWKYQIVNGAGIVIQKCLKQQPKYLKDLEEW